MIWNIFSFEARYWLRGMMVWIFTFIVGTMVFAAVSSDKVTVGAALENTFRNAPYVIQNFYSIMAVLTLLMTTAFVNGAAARDFQYGTSQLIFSTPIKKLDFLLGRFLGAAAVSVIPMLGISLGIILAAYMPWVDAERWGPIVWAAHGQSILVFAIPNTLFISAVVFCIAALTRSTVTSFIGGLLLIVAYTVADTLTQDLDNEALGMLLDPFGARTYSILTKYWTVADKNTLSLGLTGMMLWNRLLWLAVGIGLFAFTAWRFTFSDRVKKGQAPITESAPQLAVALPEVRYETNAAWSQLRRLLSFEFWGLVKTTSFIVLLVAALLNTIPNVILSAREGYGNGTYPVTYWILNIIQSTLYIFTMSMITYYAGVLVWRERDARMDEIEDVTPHPSWIRYLSKALALLGVLALLQAVLMLTGTPSKPPTATIVTRSASTSKSYSFTISPSSSSSPSSRFSFTFFRPTSTSATSPSSPSSLPTPPSGPRSTSPPASSATPPAPISSTPISMATRPSSPAGGGSPPTGPPRRFSSPLSPPPSGRAARKPRSPAASPPSTRSSKPRPSPPPRSSPPSAAGSIGTPPFATKSSARKPCSTCAPNTKRPTRNSRIYRNLASPPFNTTSTFTPSAAP